MNPERDPLWDPTLQADAELAHLQNLLTPYAARRDLPCPLTRPAAASGPESHQPLAVPAQRGRRVLRPVLAASAGLMLLLLAAAVQRFWWPEDQAWRVQTAAGETRFERGQIYTASTASEIAVAHIGRLRLAPATRLSLLGTRTGAHRVALEEGRIEARIWAPPGWFGVQLGAAELIDLGCEFVLQRSADGTGSVEVLSGWVAWRLGEQDHLLPAGYRFEFGPDAVDIAMRPDAPAALRAALRDLRNSTGAARQMHADRVAAAARNADAYTLLDLLTRDPALAQSALYPRLAAALNLTADDVAHRAAWARGDVAAINAWWAHWPVPPKAWWRHWRDAWDG